MARAVETVRRVPDKHRDFRVDGATLRRVHRIDDTLLAQLLDHGLPHRDTGPERRFDALDAENLGLLLDLPSPRRLAMRGWRAALDTADRHPAQVCTMRLGPARAARQASGADPCTLNGRLVDAAVPGSVSRVAPDAYTLKARLTRARGAFAPAFAPLIEDVVRLRFHLIPRGLWGDLGFVAETKLADCGLAAQFAAARAAERGLAVRQAEGLFVLRPYAVRHWWLEFSVDGEWTAADPFMLTALARWGLVDPREWPPTRSPQAVLWRLGPDAFPLLTRGGRAVGPAIAVVSAEPAADQCGRTTAALPS